MERIERREYHAVALQSPGWRPKNEHLGRAFILGILSSTAVIRPAFADNWRISPSIGIQESYNTNTQGFGNQGLGLQGTTAQGVTTPGQGDVITAITPTLSVTGQTAHTDIAFNYAPTYDHFLFGTSPDRIDQSLNATGVITPFSEFLRIDLAAYATEAGSTPNSFVGASGLLVPGADRVLYYIGKVAPHFQAHFKEIATLDASYRVTSSNTSDEGISNGIPTHVSSDSLAQEAQVVIASGGSLGQLAPSLNLDHAFTTGSGLNSQSSNDADFLTLQYHLNHEYALTGSIGYQKTFYGATTFAPAYNNEGMTWNIGVNITPNDVSSVSLGYGRQQNAYSPNLRAQYTLNQTTSIFASYIVVDQNQLQSVQQNLEFLAHDAFGNAIDSRTGLPFSGVNPAFGSQNVLFRDEPFLLTVSKQFQRASAALTFTYDVRSSLSGIAASTTSWGISITYSRQLTPVIQANANFGFTDSSGAGAIASGIEHSQLYNAGFSLTYAINAHTIMTLNEYYYNRISNIPANSSMTNQLTIGLRRDF